MAYVFLAIAIVAETSATMALKASDGFSKVMPSLFVIGGYGLAFFLMSIVMRTVPVGITYAIWSGVGIILISTVSYFAFKQTLDWPAILGICLIIAGVLVINVFSKATVP